MPIEQQRIPTSSFMKNAHSSITLDRVMDAVQEDNNSGFCLGCGEEQLQCEPDMRKGKCESCGESKVYGAEELLFHIAT